MGGVVEKILRELGFVLTPVPDAHLCCGSAGTYSLLQPSLSQSLRKRKLETLMNGSPVAVATANIGCLLHLQGHTAAPVMHWLNVVADG